MGKNPKRNKSNVGNKYIQGSQKWAKNEIHLDKFVSRGWDLLSGSSLEVGHTRWDVLALPSKWWKLWLWLCWFFFDNENDFKCTCILVPGTTCLRRIFERAALSPSNRYICSINIFFRNNLNGDFNYLMNIMKMKDKGEYGNKHLKVGVWDLLEGKVGWSKDSERAYLI